MDLSLLTSLMSGDEQLVARFVAIFKAQVPDQVRQLPELYGNQEWEALSSSLHSLKSQFNYVGMKEFAGQMQEMEESVDNGETADLADPITAFTKTFDAFWQRENAGK